MNPLVFVLAAACGGLGAAARYLVDIGVARVSRSRFPWGVMVINITGSLLLGLVVGMLPAAAFVVGAGFLGGYTTFSTAMVDALSLWRDGKPGAAVVDVVGMLVLSLSAALVGLGIGGALG
ncbi:fluoride efflux transporter FluC [Microbacterium sp. NPDC089987]|uniref:fluoride efflux transporter FluC n=1 Tax=Microbacterium sp. NPDC089987 TaxID=3364202 RepID=UPI00381B2C15